MMLPERPINTTDVRKDALQHEALTPLHELTDRYLRRAGCLMVAVQVGATFMITVGQLNKLVPFVAD